MTSARRSMRRTRAVLAAIEDLDEDTGWAADRCAGWTVRDLIWHLLSDTQRALVALHTPADGTADVDAVSYWVEWRPGTPGAEAGRRGTRIMASAWSGVRSIADLYDETARAVLVAAEELPGDELVHTQGKVLSVDALLSTLAVEATMHHLDLGLGTPTAAGLTEVRRVLDGLLGSGGADRRRRALRPRRDGPSRARRGRGSRARRAECALPPVRLTPPRLPRIAGSRGSWRWWSQPLPRDSGQGGRCAAERRLVTW